jgi:hypothetical protein
MAKTRVGVYFEPSLHDVLVELADQETRSIANLVERLVIEALQHRGVVEMPEKPKIQLDKDN